MPYRSIQPRIARAATRALVLGGLIALASAAEAEDRPAIALRKSGLETLVETEGEVYTVTRRIGPRSARPAQKIRVRVTVDRRGEVSKAEVLSIEPPGPNDEATRERTVRSLERWRYAPALEDGEPVESELEWTIQLHAREGSPAGIDARTRLPFEAAEGSAAHRVAAMSLSAERRAELLERYARAAESVFEGQTRAVVTPRFRVVGEAASETAIDGTAGNLEAAFATLDDLFASDLPLQPADHRVVAYVYRTKDQFHRAVRELGAFSVWPGGLYLPPGLLLFSLQASSADGYLHLLLHEAFHAYTDQHLAAPGRHLPLWLDEGLAEYVGNSRIKKGRLVPGKVLQRRLVMLPFGVARLPTLSGFGVEWLKKSFADAGSHALRELIDAEHSTFYGLSSHRLFSSSWLLVHFLRHGEPGWAEDEFPRLVLYLSEGYGSSEALTAIYGVPPEALEEPFARYVKTF